MQSCVNNEAISFNTQTPLKQRGFWYTKNTMANKAKKKRNKQYRGTDAAMARPSVTRISAANRTKVGQWWFERKKVLKPVLIVVGVALIVTWLIIEAVRIIAQ